MKTISPEEFEKIKKKIKILDRLNKTLLVCLVVASVNLVLLFFGIDLLEWGRSAAAEAVNKWGPEIESVFYELTEIFKDRSAS